MSHRISAAQVQAHRAQTFHLSPAQRLHSLEAAIDFVNARGFIYFWPITGVIFPSLWTAAAGDRPVASAHDDPGHITWGWKDQALGQGCWHYAKVLRGKATLIALDMLPAFYALSENYGAPEQDYLDQYTAGLLGHEARLIYEKLLHDGPCDTVTLRRDLRLTSQASDSPFDRSLTHLQRDFKIMPVGVAQTGAWRYSFIYDCVHRRYPGLPAQARRLSRQAARTLLLARYFQAMGAAPPAAPRKLFQWRPADLTAALDALAAQGLLRHDCQMEGEAGECLALTTL
ncbi:MAG: winged helix DNA-binding domain-containing protein [Caldilineales bacterium]|nr:winged helix DNA-binding domain-containing protein [Caldilineales bacterium]